MVKEGGGRASRCARRWCTRQSGNVERSELTDVVGLCAVARRFAKLFGSYRALHGGLPHLAWATMTGLLTHVVRRAAIRDWRCELSKLRKCMHEVYARPASFPLPPMHPCAMVHGLHAHDACAGVL
jgi:hypothetical protein